MEKKELERMTDEEIRRSVAEITSIRNVGLLIGLVVIIAALVRYIF